MRTDKTPTLVDVERDARRWSEPPNRRAPKPDPDNELGQLILRRFREITRDDPRYDATRNVLEWCERLEHEWAEWEDDATEVLAQLGRPDQAEIDAMYEAEDKERDFKEMYR